MVRLYIIRHGDPYYEAPNGGSLTEHGKAEATALASFLAKEGITHAYTSPLGRAKLTAMLGLSEIVKFSTNHVDEQNDEQNDDDDEEDKNEIKRKKNNFEQNVPVEDWCRELSLWRCLDDYECQHATRTRSAVKRNPAIWDFPAPIVHSQLDGMIDGTTEEDTSSTSPTPSSSSKEEGCVESTKEFLSSSSKGGWTKQCPDHGMHNTAYKEFCANLDVLLSRHGIINVKPEQSGMNESHYYLSKELINDQEKRVAKIAIFCHNGTGLTMLSHLLRIPLPMVYASMWLAPSAVSTIVFDEYPAKEMEKYLVKKKKKKVDANLSDVIVSPKALCIGGTNHLAMAGLSVPNSKYEDHERPSGIKHNFY